MFSLLMDVSISSQGRSVLISQALVQRVINRCLQKVISAAFRLAPLHLDGWGYIHLPTPPAIEAINETLVSSPPTFFWGEMLMAQN